MEKSRTISQFLTSHLWQIILLGISGLIGFVMMKAEISKNEFRIKAIEEKQATYPSQDWFELKFETLEKKIENQGKW